MEPRSIRPFFKLGDSDSGLKLSIHMVYQGLSFRDLARSCQSNLGRVKVMGSPAEPGRAEAPWNWSKTPPIIIINQPPPPLALPRSTGCCSHQLGNSLRIEFASLRGQIRPPVQKLRTIENWSDVQLKLYLGVFRVFPKCLSVFPPTCDGPARSVDSKCHIGEWIWRSVFEVMVGGTFLMPTHKTVFGPYLGRISCIFEPYFCMCDPTGGSGSV